jgi:hypothetical protein
VVNLRQLAESDLAFTLEDDANGFGWEISITSPAGLTRTLKGQTGDISKLIDPNTGEAVSGRLTTATLRLSSLKTAFSGDIPEGINDPAKKPWLCGFSDLSGSAYKFKVLKSEPDRTLGFVALTLGLYKDS